MAAADWLRVHPPRDAELVGRLLAQLQRGEAEAIAIALELGALLLIDDRAARREATRLKIDLTGTLGLLIQAESEGLISQIRPVTEELVNAGVRLSPRLISEVLAEAGEDD